MGQDAHTDRNADQAAGHERPEPAERDVVAQRPDRAALQQRAAGDDHECRMQRIEPCSQIDDAVSAKAKPAPPEATAPRKPPSQIMASVRRIVAVNIGSDHIDHEHQADRDAPRRRRARRRRASLAQAGEFDRQYAQAQRQMGGERQYQPELGKFDERRID